MHPSKLVFVRTSAAPYLPPGGRGTAKRWMRNGDTFPFLTQSSQRVQPFPMYLFNERHTDSEHIAVPHPPPCGGTFPPGEGIVRHSSLQIPICRTLGNAGKHISKSSPKGIHSLISYISYLISPPPAPSATGDRWAVDGEFGGSISGGIVVSSGHLKTERS